MVIFAAWLNRLVKYSVKKCKRQLKNIHNRKFAINKYLNQVAHLRENLINMDDLLKSQIHENCRLALPEGLKDLMSDISREVLRAQPQNLYQFITDYLGALLEARETLTIACQLCTDICNCRCDPIIPELYNELRKIGLDEEDLNNAIQVTENYLRGDQKANESVKEQTLLMKLLRKTSIDSNQLPAVQLAFQKAFTRHNLGHGDLIDIPKENDNEASVAVQNTLHLYTQHKIQNEAEELFVAEHFKPCVATVSSTSLAGSYVTLPAFRPYSAHDSEILSAIPEKQHLSIDYTKDASTTELKPNRIEITDGKTILNKNDQKDKATVLFVNNNHILEDRLCNDGCLPIDYTEARTSAGYNPNKIKICKETSILDESEATEFFNDYNDLLQDKEDSDDEVEESIEHFESENESCVSSIEESLQDHIEQ